MDSIKRAKGTSPARVEASAGATETSKKQVSSEPSPVVTESVTISGRAHLVSRVFGTSEDRYTEVVAKRNQFSVIGNYLTVKDRRVVEQMYDYATANNIDLKHVDNLAQDLGMYRGHGKSEIDGLYDNIGRKRTFEFSPSDKAIAERLAASSTASLSGLDADFVQSELVVGTHLANFAFLEHMVNVLSGNSDANKGVSLDPYDRSANALVMTASEKIELVVPEADYVSENGVGYRRNPAMANGNFPELNGLFGSSTVPIAEMLHGLGKENGVPAKSLNGLLDMLYPEKKRSSST